MGNNSEKWQMEFYPVYPWQMGNNSEKWQMEFHPVYPWQHQITFFALEAVISRVFCFALLRWGFEKHKQGKVTSAKAAFYFSLGWYDTDDH